MHAMKDDDWWAAAKRPQNAKRNCRVPTGPLPYPGTRLRPDVLNEAHPGGVFTVRGDRPEPIMSESALKLFQLVARHAMRK
eukprot:14187741-Alexandrium_andersonii.AAC.1